MIRGQGDEARACFQHSRRNQFAKHKRARAYSLPGKPRAACGIDRLLAKNNTCPCAHLGARASPHATAPSEAQLLASSWPVGHSQKTLAASALACSSASSPQAASPDLRLAEPGSEPRYPRWLEASLAWASSRRLVELRCWRPAARPEPLAQQALMG